MLLFTSQPPAPLTRASLYGRCLAFALLALAAGLAVTSYFKSASELACGEAASDCSGVTGGVWAYWLAVFPVSWAGVLAYGGLAIAAVLSRRHALADAAIRPLCGLVIGAGLWFTFVQAFILQQFCPLCMTTHACAGIASCLLLRVPVCTPSLPGVRFPTVAAAFGTIAVLAFGAPWTVQRLIQPRSMTNGVAQAALVEKGQGDELHLLGASTKLKASSLPRIGSLDAKHVAVMIMNHDCPHCVRQLRALREMMGDFATQDLAIYFVPVGTNATNAEAQAMLLAIWAGQPEVHDEIVEELADKRLALTAEAIRQSAIRHASAERVEHWLAKSSLQQARDQLIQHGQLVKAASETRGFKGLPQLWFPDGAELGSSEETAFYYQTFARRLGVHRSAEPRLIVAEKAITLGRTPVSGQALHSLNVTNDGTGELTIRGLKLPTGWMAISTFPAHVAPTQSLRLDLQIASPSQPGPWTSEVHILSNASASVPAITFHGEAMAPLRQGKERLVLPDVNEGSQLVGEELTLEPQPGFAFGAATLDMKSFVATQVAADPPRLRFAQSDPLPVGGYLGTLRLPVRWSSSGIPWTVPALELQVSAHVRAPVIVTPQRVVLSPQIQDQAQTYTIAMRPRDGTTKLAPTIELPTTLRAAGVTATLSAADQRQGIEITLHLPPQFNPAPHIGAQIALRSGLDHSGSFTLPIEFAGRRPRPSFALNPPR